ncbi:MAG: DUF2971 domain-containing protein [Hyphomicrobiaceae bacterium]
MKVGGPDRARKAIQDFEDWSEKKSAELDDACNQLGSVYHYTDMAGFAGIIGSNEIWFTDTNYLNDPSEFHYGMGLAVDSLERFAASNNENVKRFCRLTNDALVSTHKSLFLHFIACFSLSNNDLSQWRSYADNARGVAIEFSPGLFKISDKPVKDGLNNFGAVITYDEKKAKARIQEAIGRAISVVPSLPEFESMVELSAALVGRIVPYVIGCKHVAYSHEKEVRLIVPGRKSVLESQVSFRVRDSMLVPYLKVPFQLSGRVAKIFVGPAASPQAVASVSSFLRRHGFLNVPVAKSEIPYTALV